MYEHIETILVVLIVVSALSVVLLEAPEDKEPCEVGVTCGNAVMVSEVGKEVFEQVGEHKYEVPKEANTIVVEFGLQPSVELTALRVVYPPTGSSGTGYIGQDYIVVETDAEYDKSGGGNLAPENVGAGGGWGNGGGSVMDMLFIFDGMSMSGRYAYEHGYIDIDGNFIK